MEGHRSAAGWGRVWKLEYDSIRPDPPTPEPRLDPQENLVHVMNRGTKSTGDLSGIPYYLWNATEVAG